jgi:hypothetical protein
MPEEQALVTEVNHFFVWAKEGVGIDHIDYPESDPH